MKGEQDNKSSLRNYLERSKDPVIDSKITMKQQKIDKNKEIERENGILSKKLIDIISKKRQKSQEFQNNPQKAAVSQKSKEIQIENLRMFNLLTNMKPLIVTKELKQSWKMTKKYKRNLLSFNKFNQPKKEMNFLNKICNKNIAIYLKECYLTDKSNVLNVNAPNYKVKMPERRERKIIDRSLNEKRPFSCETCHKRKEEEHAKNFHNGTSKLLLDYSMAF